MLEFGQTASPDSPFREQANSTQKETNSRTALRTFMLEATVPTVSISSSSTSLRSCSSYIFEYVSPPHPPLCQMQKDVPDSSSRVGAAVGHRLKSTASLCLCVRHTAQHKTHYANYNDSIYSHQGACIWKDRGV